MSLRFIPSFHVRASTYTLSAPEEWEPVPVAEGGVDLLTVITSSRHGHTDARSAVSTPKPVGLILCRQMAKCMA